MAENEETKFFYETRLSVLGVKFHNSGIDMKKDANDSMKKYVENLKESLTNVSFQLLDNGQVCINFQNDDNDKSEEDNQENKHNESLKDEIIAKNSIHFPNEHLDKHVDSLLNSPQYYSIDQTFFYRGELNSPIERCLVLATSTLSYPQPNVPQIQFIILYGNCPAQISDLVEACRRLTERQAMLRTLADSANKQQHVQHQTNSIEINSNEFKISMSGELEIQEDFGDGKWHCCNIDKDSFRIRANLEKKIYVTIKQDPQQLINIEKCFGMLLSPGRYVGSSDMVAIGSSLKNISDVPGSKLKQWTVLGAWVPSELNFELLNTETSGDSRVYFSIAIDLIIEHIDEPVRFIFETKAKIVQPSQWTNTSTSEKIWQLANLAAPKQKHLVEHFHLTLLQEGDLQSRLQKYKVTSCYSVTQLNAQKKQLSLQLNSIKNSVAGSNGNDCKSLDSIETPTTEDMEDSDDEPIASGTGQVSKECAQDVLNKWKVVMDEWRKKYEVRPKNLSKLVRKGVPEALRPEVWQVLSGSNQVEEKLMRQYTVLLASESKFEAIIRRDISRTFPAHEMFKEPGGIGQESLFKICKAYSNYDTEIGYCQGLSFLIAALLLHMPEEQAFCVLVRIMYDYKLRELYKSGFEELHCKFYQLERMLQHHIPELFAHFNDLHIETHMYASQWFLTLYTTKFPLNAVFLIIDLFLLNEMDTLLQIAIAMLKLSKADLLTLDFEGILKYFRINLPKKYRNEENAQKLIRSAVKINTKKAKDYEAIYKKFQEAEKIRLNPLQYLELENKRLMNMNIRLEQENNDLATEITYLVKMKGDILSQMANLDNQVFTLKKELNSVLINSQKTKTEFEENRAIMSEELENIKILKSEDELLQKDRIIEDYKSICKSRETTLENEKIKHETIIKDLRAKVSSCDQCSAAFNDTLAEEYVEDPKQNDLIHKMADLRAELIQAKLDLAEANAKNDEISGELRKTNSELNLMKSQNENQQHQRSNTWFGKSFMTSIRDATAKTVKPSNSLHGFHNQNSAETLSVNETSENDHNSSEPVVDVKRRFSHNRDTLQQTNNS